MSEQIKDREDTIDELFGKLDVIMKKMQDSETSLEDSFSCYHEGIDLLKACNSKIDMIEKKIMILDDDGEAHEFE